MSQKGKDKGKKKVQTRGFFFYLILTHAFILSPLCSEEISYLIDAGLWTNVPYPPFLGGKRGIDLIIASDFSGGEIFSVQLNAFKQVI